MANDVFSIRNDIKVEFEIATPGNWIWGVSTWDGGDVWGDSSSSIAWTDLLCEVTAIDIDRGCDVSQGIFPEAGTGRATITMTSDTYDPFSHGTIHAGVPVKISYRPEPDTFPSVWETLFVGTVEAFTATYDREGRNLFKVTATQSMLAFLNSVQSYLTFTYNFDSGYMISDLATNHWTGGTTYIDTGSTWESWQAVALTQDTQVGEIVRKVLMGGLGYLWTTKDNELIYSSHDSFDNILGLTPDFYLSNTHSAAIDHVCISDLNFIADTKNAPNTIIAEWIDALGNTKQIVRANADAVALYGEVSVTGETGQNTSINANYWLDQITISNKLRSVKSATFQPIQRDGTMRIWHLSDRLFSLINVTYDKNALHVNDNYVVTRQQDTITPYSWDTTIELWKGI